MLPDWVETEVISFFSVKLCNKVVQHQTVLSKTSANFVKLESAVNFNSSVF